MSKIQDLYERVTAKIIADLEKGELTWRNPWEAGDAALPLRSNGMPYHGINVLMLWGAALEKGYGAPTWMTYKQAQELGGQVRKGEKGTTVVYANSYVKAETGDDGEEVETRIPVLKTYTVFNVEQIDGLPERFYQKPAAILDPAERLEAIDAFVAATGADIRHGGGRAFYRPAGDYVQMPAFEAFRDKESYYATLTHELTHWTGHLSRLARDFERKRWGDEGYAMEELVAELGAAFLCAGLGLMPEPREDTAAYIQSWLKVLKSDPQAIFHAASHAQKAADFLYRHKDKAEERLAETFAQGEAREQAGELELM